MIFNFFIFLASLASSKRLKTIRAKNPVTYAKITSPRECMPSHAQKMWADAHGLNCEGYARRLKCRADGMVQIIANASDWLSDYQSQL